MRCTDFKQIHERMRSNAESNERAVLENETRAFIAIAENEALRRWSGSVCGAYTRIKNIKSPLEKQKKKNKNSFAALWELMTCSGILTDFSNIRVSYTSFFRHCLPNRVLSDRETRRNWSRIPKAWPYCIAQ